jgi:Fe-S cluster assembly protein SufD
MADVMLMKTPAEQQLAAEWQKAKGRLPGPAAPREEAFRRFEAQGLPHRRVEEWKYTDLRALMREASPLASPPDAKALKQAKAAGKILAKVKPRRLVVANGVFVPELSDLANLEPGLSVQALAAALAAGDAFVIQRLGKTVAVDDMAVTLNTAFMGDGIVIRVAKDAVIARPLHLVSVFSGDAAASVFTRSLVVVEEGARLTLLESHEGPSGVNYHVNAALELVVGDRAHVDHVKIGSEGAQAVHVSSLLASVGGDARLHDLTFTTGGAVSRNQIFLRLDGEGTSAVLRGATLLKGRQHADTTLVVDHAAGGCESREVFKSVLDGESRGVFQGKIIVRQGAQKTDGKMMTRALLLSETAEADAKPELEIFADDVQCGHGATAGALDEDLLFYLRARGIPLNEAEALMIQSFIGEVLEGLEHEGLREALLATAEQWLAARV